MRRLKARRPDTAPRMGSHAAPPPWLDQAHAAGRLTCRGGAVVRRILVDKSGHAEGAEWYDCDAGRLMKASAPLVFLCASAIESTRILMLSAGRPGAESVGMHSPALGRYLMDHAKVSGGGFAHNLPGMADQKAEQGRSIYVPNYGPAGTSFGLQVHVHPRSAEEVRVDILSFAEILPEADNRIELDPSRLDAFGMPVPKIRLRFSDAQLAAGAQQIAIVRQIIDDLQLKHVTCSSELAAPGTALHESGTARMGINPETSVVDPNNECWDAKGLYVTDGACFPRVSLQNPTLAIMALTARATEHAAASVSKKPPTETQVIRQSFAPPSASSAQDIVVQG
jgi:choline dehydrogenase-like flavoprotein